MDRGIKIEVFGDSSLFTRLGKGVCYLVRAEDAAYLIDCGSTPFLALGHEGIRGLRGLVATHSHEDHRRWFTDLVLYIHYHPDLKKRLRLITSEAIHEEYEKNSEVALERSLSTDRSRIVDVPYGEFVEKVVLGPRARYRIESRPNCGDTTRVHASAGKGLEVPDGDSAPNRRVPTGRVWRVVETATGEAAPPSLAKVVVNPSANRPRMLFKDPSEDVWVEPESYYPFASPAFYGPERNDLVDGETGLRIRAVKAPTWHGPPAIGVLIERGEERVAFSSDTVYDTDLWRKLAETRRDLPPEARTPGFEEACVVEGNINDFLERIWSRERYDEALRSYEGAVVIHDADFERSVVHTSHSKFTPDSDWKRLVLTHTPDGFASHFPMTYTGKRYLLERGDIYEEVDGRAMPLDADLHFKTADGSLIAGYRNARGEGRLWETARGLAVETGHDRPPAPDAKLVGRYDLYLDLGGGYYPAGPVLGGTGAYRTRSDGRVELVTETPEGSSGKIVESLRGRRGPGRTDKSNRR